MPCRRSHTGLAPKDGIVNKANERANPLICFISHQGDFASLISEGRTGSRRVRTARSNGFGCLAGANRVIGRLLATGVARLGNGAGRILHAWSLRVGWRSKRTVRLWARLRAVVDWSESRLHGAGTQLVPSWSGQTDVILGEQSVASH
jgi:hypothetical protein